MGYSVLTKSFLYLALISIWQEMQKINRKKSYKQLQLKYYYFNKGQIQNWACLFFSLLIFSLVSFILFSNLFICAVPPFAVSIKLSMSKSLSSYVEINFNKSIWAFFSSRALECFRWLLVFVIAVHSFLKFLLKFLSSAF